jgi:lactate dehydrogenase-like 2-hydroxyacid dehydrogenase
MKLTKSVVLAGSDLLTNQTVRWLKNIFDLYVIDYNLDEHHLATVLGTYDAVGLIHGGGTFISDHFFRKCPRLEWNIFPGMEPFPIYNRPALDYAKEHNIPIYPTGGGIQAVVETTLQQISDPILLKKRATGWRREIPFNLNAYHAAEELSVIGLGNLGKEILLRCQASGKFGHILFSGRKENPEFTKKTGIPFVPMNEAFKADVVIITVAHIYGVTDNYIGRDLLNEAAPHSLIINNVRPQIMNMAETLKFADERPDVTIIIDASPAEIVREYGQRWLDAIDKLPNIILTGHTAWKKPYTRKEYSVETRRVITEKILA